MKTYSLGEINNLLRGLGVETLSSEACGLGMRVLADVSPTADPQLLSVIRLLERTVARKRANEDFPVPYGPVRDQAREPSTNPRSRIIRSAEDRTRGVTI